MDAKKNVTLEIRLPDETKAAFMARCRAQDRTASEAVRGFIDSQIDQQPVTVRRRVHRGALIWTMGLAFGAGLATPSLARPDHARAASFAALDRNHDGVLSRHEFAAH